MKTLWIIILVLAAIAAVVYFWRGDEAGSAFENKSDTSSGMMIEADVEADL